MRLRSRYHVALGAVALVGAHGLLAVVGLPSSSTLWLLYGSTAAAGLAYLAAGLPLFVPGVACRGVGTVFAGVGLLTLATVSAGVPALAAGLAALVAVGYGTVEVFRPDLLADGGTRRARARQ